MEAMNEERLLTPAFAPASSSAPTREQRAAMTALPAQLLGIGASNRSGRNGKKKSGGGARARLAKEGQVISKWFNEVGNRPQPAIVSLEQTIRATLESSTYILTTNTATTSFGAAAVTLSQFGTSSEYTGLFDQYMIEQVEVWIEPVAAQGTTVFGDVTTAVDLDDASVPTTLQALKGKGGALGGQGGAGRYHRWRPHVAVAAYSGTFTSYANTPASWIDCASPSVQHFGIKIGAGATSVAITYQCTFRILAAFRAPGI